MKIKHKETGNEINEVGSYNNIASTKPGASLFKGWMKDHTRYLMWDGWEEVKEEKWEIVEMSFDDREFRFDTFSISHYFVLPEGYRWMLYDGLINSVVIEKRVEA